MSTTTTTPEALDTADAPTFAHTATYSPEDNKLRIYPGHRLSAEDYARVKAAGFVWAPRQELFVAPMWTPERADICEEFAGEIGDEDKSLTERAEERADRFTDYSANRAQDADQARVGVERITSGIPLGQPILVGHHSERHARKDAERIESGMRRAVKMWETSEYWTRRAAGAVRAAKYKESPAVRARRIKGIEADARKVQKGHDEAALLLKAWRGLVDAGGLKLKAGGLSTFADGVQFLADRSGIWRCFTLADFPRDLPAKQYEGIVSLGSAVRDGVCPPERAAALAILTHGRQVTRAGIWLAHYANRLAYERAMLAEGGGLVADKFNIQPGGVITHRGRRSVVLRVNMLDGRPLSLSVTGQSWTVGMEEVTDYEPASETAAAAVAKAVKLAPLVNFDGGASFARMTEAQYKALYEGARNIGRVKATETHDAYRVRRISGYKSVEFGGPNAAGYDMVPVFLTDAKVKPAPPVGGEPPKPKRKSIARKIAESEGVDTSGQSDPPAAPAPTLRDVVAEATEPTLADVLKESARLQAGNETRAQRKADAAPFDAMREALRTGQAVQVVSVPQLFPTPADVAARMVALADIKPGDRVLEPSAGTGALLGALGGKPWAGLSTAEAVAGNLKGRALVHAVEINATLANRLDANHPLTWVHRADFLAIEGPESGVSTLGAPAWSPLGLFDVILMNPPFKDAADVAHIRHARRFLAPGGRLVAICAAGSRQHDALQGLADSWEYLEPGTFAGTNVRAVLLAMGPTP